MTWDTMVAAAIVVAAVGYLVWRYAFRKSGCGCGCGSGGTGSGSGGCSGCRH